jgi:hypothetical protein
MVRAERVLRYRADDRGAEALPVAAIIAALRNTVIRNEAVSV